ncbi:MAG: thiamine phosphate synthase [Planctomycetes bacterium]|nr:thiamine phosphate synthase [Planctomycetota bacterium]
MSHTARILDANANRAREALRVMEEAARFRLGDADLTTGLKQLRHDLSESLLRFDNLDLNRDTPGDVGTKISTPAERTRSSTAEVVIAAGKRLGEAMRVLEEYGKTIDAGFAASIQTLRYCGYDLEHRLNRALGSGRARQWQICVIFSEKLCGDRDWREVAQLIADAEPDCIQLREKELDDGELLSRARLFVQMAGPRTTVIINDRPDIALLASADGVHLGQTDLPCSEVRKIVGRQLIVGVSTSALSEAEQALRDGADYCGVGPMFPTTTKRKDTIVGPDYLRRYLAWNKLPHVAIGGISPDNIDRLVQLGVKGVAVSAAVCGADQPDQVIHRLREALCAATPAEV